MSNVSKGSAAHERYEAARLKREELMRLISEEHMTIDQALTALPWSKTAYYSARKHHPNWARLIDEAIWRRYDHVSKDKTRTISERSKARWVRDRNPHIKKQKKPLTHAEWSAIYLHRQHLAHQLELAEALDRTQPGEITLFLVWPGAGKSTTLVDWVTRRVCEFPNEKVLYLSESSDLTDDFVAQIQKRLRLESEDGDTLEGPDYSEMHKRYGPFYEKGQEKHGKPWSRGRFTVVKATEDAKDPTVAAVAITSRAYGRRCNTLIVDDVQSEVSLGQTEKYLAILRKTYFNRDTPANPMRIFVCGTRIGKGDIYERMIEEGIVDHVVEWQAVTFDGKPTVPRAWVLGDKKLKLDKMTDAQIMDAAIANMEKRKAKVGPDAWAAQYQQRPMRNELSTFGESVDRCLDESRTVGKVLVAA